MEDASLILAEAVPDWKGVQVAFHAKYLGMLLGPRCADMLWDAALDKYITRVQMARSTGAGFIASVLEYNIMCVTTLSYIGQFCVTPQSVLAVEARMLQKLTGCPRYTFTKEALWSLELFGMAKGFNSIRICNTAAMIRMVLQTATSFTKMKLCLDEALSDDQCMMLSLATNEVTMFDTPAIVNTLQTAIDCAFLPDIHHTAWKLQLQSFAGVARNTDFQGTIIRYLSATTLEFNASDFLTKRMARWPVSDAAKPWWGFIGPFVMQLCQHGLRGAPQCVIAAYIKIVLNGWASARRFKLHHSQCVFNCGSRQDSIEHYLECRHVEEIWERTSRSEWGPLESRLAVGYAAVDGQVVRVFFLYGLYSAYNQMRHGHTQGSVVDRCANIVRSKITYALGRSSANIRRLYSGMVGSARATPRDLSVTCVGEVMFNFRKRSRALALAQLASTKRGRDKGAKKARTSSCTASELHV